MKVKEVAIILVGVFMTEQLLSLSGVYLFEDKPAFKNGMHIAEPIMIDGRLTHPQALIDDDLEDYGELILPIWLSKIADCEGDEKMGCTARLKAAMAKAASKHSSPAPPKFTKHSLLDLVEISLLYTADFGIVMYDPENDDFLLLYNGGMTWVGGILKLVSTFQMLVLLLRYNFPDRFRGRESGELGECASTSCL
jgi:hypothetical protein